MHEQIKALQPLLPVDPPQNVPVELDTGLIPVEELEEIPPKQPSFHETPPIKHRESEKNNESLLSYHRSVQDELSSDLADMATQLKLNATHFSGIIEKDKALLDNAKMQLESNLTGMQRESGRLTELRSRSRGTTCFVISSVLMVTIAWVFMFLIIRVT